jgi:hypothetical protein
MSREKKKETSVKTKTPSDYQSGKGKTVLKEEPVTLNRKVKNGK